MSQKIFETTFAGYVSNQATDYAKEYIITRVEDSFVGFGINNIDQDSENITIEKDRD